MSKTAASALPVADLTTGVKSLSRLSDDLPTTVSAVARLREQQDAADRAERGERPVEVRPGLRVRKAKDGGKP